MLKRFQGPHRSSRRRQSYGLHRWLFHNIWLIRGALAPAGRTNFPGKHGSPEPTLSAAHRKTRETGHWQYARLDCSRRPDCGTEPAHGGSRPGSFLSVECSIYGLVGQRPPFFDTSCEVRLLFVFLLRGRRIFLRLRIKAKGAPKHAERNRTERKIAHAPQNAGVFLLMKNRPQ